MKKWIGAALVLALAGGLFWFFFQENDEVAAPDEVATNQVVRRSLEMVVEAAGQVEPIREIEVKSRASGEVLEVLVETGDFVERGSLLARIDPRDVENAYQQAVADLEAASVRFRIADAQRSRMEALKDSEVITIQELENAVQAAASARSELVRARTNLQLAKERRQDATIRAPADGTIIERTVEPGQIIASAISNVSGGNTLFRMADLSQMQVRANVDETDIAQVVPELTVRVSVDAWPNRTFNGVVHKVEPLALMEQNVTTFPVLVRLDNPRGMLKPGMNAEITVEVEKREEVLTIPNGAVVGMRDVMAAALALGLNPEGLWEKMRVDSPQAAESGETGSRGEASGMAAAPAGSFGRGSEEGGSYGTQENPREDSESELKPGVASRSEAESGFEPGAGAGPSALAAGMPENGSAECSSLFARLREVGMDALSSVEKATFQRCREEAMDADMSAGTQVRPAVVFVREGSGQISPRRVRIGLSDWEHSEVVSGLSEGQQVMSVSVAQLRRAQAEAQERFRRRVGSQMMPGMGRR